MKVGPILTPEDIDPLVVAGKLKSDDQLGWRDISMTQLSIARHYGGTTVNGVHYTYIPESDELVRDDVLKMVMKARADALKKPAKQAADLFDKKDARPRKARQKLQCRAGKKSGAASSE